MNELHGDLILINSNLKKTQSQLLENKYKQQHNREKNPTK